MSEPTSTPFPPPPRPITRAARRQSWREVAVRRWLAATLGIVAVVGVVGGRAVRAGLDERALLRDGVRLDATVAQIFAAAGEVDRSISRQVTLDLRLPGEAEPRRVPGNTRPQAGRIAVGRRIPVIIDPRNTSRWTDRVDPASWTETLAAPLLLLPVVALLLAMAWLRRRRLLGVWRDGTLAAGTVLEARPSAMVPGQKLVRVSIPGDAPRTVSVTHPDRLGLPQRGDAIDVVANPRGDAVLAAAYA